MTNEEIRRLGRSLAIGMCEKISELDLDYSDILKLSTEITKNIYETILMAPDDNVEDAKLNLNWALDYVGYSVLRMLEHRTDAKEG